MKMWKSLLSLAVVGLLLGAVGILNVQKVSAGMGWQTAFKVDTAFWVGGLPHYGAFFGGSYGTNQYYSGPGGSPAGYSSWDWWGTDYDVLLLQKRWLGLQSLYPERWNPANHHAFMVGY